MSSLGLQGVTPFVVYIHPVASQLETQNVALWECAVGPGPWPMKHRGFQTHLHVQPLLH